MGSGGQPKRTLDSLDSSWQDTIIGMMTNGQSKQEVKAVLNICNALHTRWMKDEPEYAETIKRGEELSQAWWEDQIRKAAIGETKGANATLFIFNMKNKFPNDWRDKTEREVSGSIGITDLTDEELDRKLAQLERDNEQSSKI